MARQAADGQVPATTVALDSLAAERLTGRIRLLAGSVRGQIEKSARLDRLLDGEQ